MTQTSKLTAGALPRVDVYARVTEKIVADLNAGVRPWARPWNAAHAAGPVSRPLRANGGRFRKRIAKYAKPARRPGPSGSTWARTR